jgi:glucose/arabinose dehydrogenase
MTLHDLIRNRSASRVLVSLAVLSLVALGSGPARMTPTTSGQSTDVSRAGDALADEDASAGRLAQAGADAAPGSISTPEAVSAPAATAFDPTKVVLGISLVKSGFSSPDLVTNAGDGSGRLFVVEQTGRIRIISGGVTLATPFLDLRTAITTGGERGLLGLAFHPDYPTHPYFYVNFTDRNGNTAIDRFTVSSTRKVANRSSGVRLLTIGQPYANHNGGYLAFGPDGYLYIGMGDGGSFGDPGNRAQSLNSLLGKMLRIDVTHASGTRHDRSPATNPYVSRAGLDEIWSRGLRNPWRWSFDRLTGQLWIGDVGQNRWEEIDRSSRHGTTPAGRAVNYGWPALEGRACYKPMTGCSTSGKQPPQTVYGHAVSGADNCAVTGGFVYRGSAYPVLAGGYVFGDFCSGRIWVMSPLASAPVTATLVRDATASPRLAISSFGDDERGELYVCDLGGGAIYQLTATAKP